jgi:pimeloyl-ACP methyl ester carboxylesterase
MNWDDWQMIDLAPKGKAGVEARYRIHKDGDRKVFFLFIKGSDSSFDWFLHILPTWDAGAELIYATALYNKLKNEIDSSDLIYLLGHSWGGAIAATIRVLLPKDVLNKTAAIGYGSKRPAFGWLTALYRMPGDWVPFLPPWRSAAFWETKVIDTKWQPIWKAHRWENYESLLKQLLSRWGI